MAIDLQLTPHERADMAAFGAMPQAKTFLKILRAIAIDSRDRACSVDPSKVEEQRAQTTIAYAQNEFLNVAEGLLQFTFDAHRAELKAKELEEDLKDQELVEQIILKHTIQ